MATRLHSVELLVRLGIVSHLKLLQPGRMPLECKIFYSSYKRGTHTAHTGLGLEQYLESLLIADVQDLLEKPEYAASKALFERSTGSYCPYVLNFFTEYGDHHIVYHQFGSQNIHFTLKMEKPEPSISGEDILFLHDQTNQIVKLYGELSCDADASLLKLHELMDQDMVNYPKIFIAIHRKEGKISYHTTVNFDIGQTIAFEIHNQETLLAARQRVCERIIKEVEDYGSRSSDDDSTSGSESEPEEDVSKTIDSSYFDSSSDEEVVDTSILTISSDGPELVDSKIYIHIDESERIVDEGFYRIKDLKSGSYYPFEESEGIWVLRGKFQLDLEPVSLLKEHLDWLTLINKFLLGYKGGKIVLVTNVAPSLYPELVKAYQIVKIALGNN